MADDLWNKAGDFLSRKFFEEAWTRMRAFFAKPPQTVDAGEVEKPPPKRGILILGPGGTGKTTLSRLLAGDVQWLLDEPWTYAESLDTERRFLLQDQQVEVVLPPGQLTRRDLTWPELLAELSAGQFSGIILLTAYGYHSLAVRSYQQHPLFNKDEGLAQFRLNFAKAYRDREIQILDQLLPHVRVCQDKMWLLTVVAKEDLWCDQENAVHAHYSRGEYTQKISEMTAGQIHRRHELVQASLVICNLVTQAGEVLFKCREGYDHQRQVQSVRRLIAVLDKLRDWEERS